MKSSFPKDIVERAKVISSDIGSLGSCYVSQGLVYVRLSVANYTEERDRYPSHAVSIYLTAAASSAVS